MVGFSSDSRSAIASWRLHALRSVTPAVESSLEALDVGTGGEVGLPGDDDSPDRGVGQPAEALLQLQCHLFGKGVHRGAVEADQGHRAVDRDLNVIHGPRLGRT